jgi:hypothetical protein
MAKKKNPEPEPVAPPVGALSIEAAMEHAVQALGPVTIDPQLAPEHLSELAECYDEIERTAAKLARKTEDAKTAREAHQVAVDHLLERVRAMTHPDPLPLFDAPQAEADRDRMIGGESLGPH